jgi:hypothetical protein
MMVELTVTNKVTGRESQKTSFVSAINDSARNQHDYYYTMFLSQLQQMKYKAL